MLNSNTFYGTRGSRTGSIIIVGESWGKTEQLKQKPFVGATGEDLEKLLYEASIPINECFFTNVVSARPDNNDMVNFFYRTGEANANKVQSYKGLFPKPIVLDGIQVLKDQINTIKPKLIIGLGAYSLWALTDSNYNIGNAEGYKVPTGISQWRGSQLYTDPYFGKYKLLPTYHPAAALQGAYAWRYMIKHDLSSRVKLAFQEGKWDEPEYNFIVQPSFDTVTKYLTSILSSLEFRPTEICLDLETSISRQVISCVGISSLRGEALCIPFMCLQRPQGYWIEEEEFIIISLLRKILAHPNLLLIGHNLLFDCQFIIDQIFVRPLVYFDTMIGQHILWPGGGDPSDRSDTKNVAQGIQRKALYNCASLYCDHYRYWKDEGKDFDEIGLSDELTGWRYNCRDVIKTFEVKDVEAVLIKQFGLEEQFKTQMRVANEVALDMMVTGVRINTDVKTQVSKELSEALQKYDKELIDLIPEDIRKRVEPKTFKKDKVTGKKEKTTWPSSSTQQKQIFHDILGIPPIFIKNKAGKHKGERKATLNKDALPILAQREPIIAPIIERLETRRSIGVFQKTFGESHEEPDGRMRCDYAVTGTDTYRFASRKNIYGRGGNLQNIPSGKEKSLFHFPNMRRFFEPDVGCELAEYDLSGADAAVVAWEAEDKELKDAFRAGKKVHLVNVRMLFGHETKDMTDEEIKAGSGVPGSFYDSVKKGGHATNYGAEAQTLSHRLKWTISKSEEFQERWFTAHPGIRRWHERTDRWIAGLQCWKCMSMTEGRTICPSCSSPTGRTISNKFGYRIVYFDRINDLKKKALAWLPQSSVAINVNKGALALKDDERTCSKVQLLLQVHDSLIIQYPIKYSNSIQSDIKEVLHTVTLPYPDPLIIQWNAKVSRSNWGDCEAVSW